MFVTLEKIARVLNENNIKWAVGGSLLLNHFNLRDVVNDIDIIVDVEDNQRANTLVKNLSSQETCRKSKIFVSDFFNEYKVDGINIDVISGFKIKNSCGVYAYDFNEDTIGKITSVNGVKIPLARLTDWYIIYHLIPNSEDKISEIEAYYQTRRPNKKCIEVAIEKELPQDIKEKLKRL